MFVLSLSPDAFESEWLENCGSDQDLFEKLGIVPQLLDVVPTRLRLKVQTIEEKLQPFNSIKAQR